MWSVDKFVYCKSLLFLQTIRVRSVYFTLDTIRGLWARNNIFRTFRFILKSNGSEHSVITIFLSQHHFRIFDGGAFSCYVILCSVRSQLPTGRWCKTRKRSSEKRRKRYNESEIVIAEKKCSYRIRLESLVHCTLKDYFPLNCLFLSLYAYYLT